MLIGVGIDLVEVARLARALERTPRLAGRVFTRREIVACEGRADRLQALAARFAAKEACLKALGTGWSAGLSFDAVEVLRERGSPPRLELHGRVAARAAELGVLRVHVSLTHQPGVAGAVVLLEGDPR